MNSKRLSLVFLLILLSLFATNTVFGSTIGEIAIEGAARTDEQVILNLLPFTVGDLSPDKETIDLAYLRLTSLNIFNNNKTKIEVVQINEETDKVIIQVDEIFYLYPSLLPYLGEKALQIYAKDVVQVIFNPLGNGMNFTLGYNWGSLAKYYDQAYSLGLSGGIQAGWNYSVNYLNFDGSRTFENKTNYQATGNEVTLRVQNHLTTNWKQIFTMNYYGADIQINEMDRASQDIITIGTIAEVKNPYSIKLRGYYLLGLNDQSSSWKVNFDTVVYVPVGPIVDEDYFNKVVFAVRGGTSSKKTPLNHQFAGGGFTALPLRGSSRELVGFSYGIVNTEYHHYLIDKLFGIGFIDLGSFWYDEIKLEKNIGLGVGYSLAPQTPLRLDIAYSLNTGDFGFGLGVNQNF